jgi:hypothetical protein
LVENEDKFIKNDFMLSGARLQSRRFLKITGVYVSEVFLSREYGQWMMEKEG